MMIGWFKIKYSLGVTAAHALRSGFSLQSFSEKEKGFLLQSLTQITSSYYAPAPTHQLR